MLSNNNKNIITITGIVDDQEVSVVAGASILDACKEAGVVVPRFCFHELLSLSGNCRMCLVEVEGLEKPIASCLTDFSENMVVYTNSLFAKKARESVLETLLVNHPLDCPICDQAGECDLQDETKTFGSNYTKYLFNKRSVEDKDCGPFIKTIMTRCIHCTRCVRFSSEVAGVDFLGTFNRGSATEIGGYSGNFFDSELSGNVIDLCPVGALTSKPFANSARP
jgi:NADH-quinone oxidoreductase subunit G